MNDGSRGRRRRRSGTRSREGERRADSAAGTAPAGASAAGVRRRTPLAFASGANWTPRCRRGWGRGEEERESLHPAGTLLLIRSPLLSLDLDLDRVPPPQWTALLRQTGFLRILIHCMRPSFGARLGPTGSLRRCVVSDAAPTACRYAGRQAAYRLPIGGATQHRLSAGGRRTAGCD